jgi:hypothetical protein
MVKSTDGLPYPQIEQMAQIAIKRKRVGWRIGLFGAAVWER